MTPTIQEVILDSNLKNWRKDIFEVIFSFCIRKDQVPATQLVYSFGTMVDHLFGTFFELCVLQKEAFPRPYVRHVSGVGANYVRCLTALKLRVLDSLERGTSP